MVDDYAWLKDENWQEVLRDPSVLDPDIRKYLEAENAYTEGLLGHTSALQKTLVAEMRGRIKEDDSSVPAPDGPFAYLRKFREGGQHEMFGRSPRDGGEIEIVLDEQSPAKGVVSDAIAPDPWIDERQGEDEKKSENFVVAREPSQSASSLKHQFCSRPESPRGCDSPTRLLLC